MLVCREAGIKPRFRNIIKSAKAKLWDLVSCIQEYWGFYFYLSFKEIPSNLWIL